MSDKLQLILEDTDGTQLETTCTRIAVMWHRGRAPEQFKTIQDATVRLKVDVISLELKDPRRDIDDAFKTATQQGADSLIVLGSPAFLPERGRLADLALRHRLPTSFQRPAYAEAGGNGSRRAPRG